MENSLSTKTNSHKFLFWCFLAWLICLGIQFPLPFIELRFAISDIFLLPFLFLVLSGKRFIWRSFLSFDFLCLLSLFSIGLVQHALVTGKITPYALVNKGIGIFVLLVSFLFVVNAIRDFKSFLQALRVFTVATGILNLLYLSGYIPFCPHWLRTVFVYGESRLRGLLVDPNAYSGFLVVAFFLHLPFMHLGRKGSLLNWIAFFSLLLGIFLSLSRSGYLAFAAGCIAVFLLSRSLSRYILAVLICVTLFMGTLALLPSASIIFARILSPSQIISRVEITKAAIRAFEEHPVIGLGLGSFFELSREHFGLPWKQIIHNTYIWFLADFGIVGFLFILLFSLHILAEGWQVISFLHQRHSPTFYYAVAVLSSLFAMMVFAIGIEALYQRHLWMLLGMLEVLRRLAKREPDSCP